jgi:ceramide glucosyltransferase
MISPVRYVVLAVAGIPGIYYWIALFSIWKFFRRSVPRGAANHSSTKPGYAPPVSILKPIRGLDPGAYENFASFCRQDYPAYEIVFCVGEEDDPAVPILEKLAHDFPERSIRILFGSGGVGSNDKVIKLARLVSEAQHEVVVISDSDVRVTPDYLRKVVAPLADSKVGAVTCFYVAAEDKNFTDSLQSIGMFSDFYAGIIVAWQLEGVKFALGPTIATTRERLAGFGGYEAIKNRPADDLLVGRLIAEQGYEVELLPYTILTVADYGSLRDLFHKRLRWIVVMRHLRPWGHFGLIFTLGLPWCLVAIAVRPTIGVALGYLGAYLAMRFAMTSMVGTWGLKQDEIWKKLALIPVWDALAFCIWLTSFSRNSIRWRNVEYYILDGKLVPVAPRDPAPTV